MVDILFPRKKKRGSRVFAQLTLWLCLSVFCNSGVLAHSSHSQMTYSDAFIKVAYRESLEILCKATDDRLTGDKVTADNNLTADDIEFLELNTPVPSEKINSTTRRLYRKMNNKGLFRYRCKNNKTNKHYISTVLVDSPPENVTDFACKSQNLEVLTCTWTAPKTCALTKYSLTFSINGHRVEPCKPRGRRTYSCSWNQFSYPRYRQLERTFLFILSASNVFGENEQKFTVDHFSVVQPAPVKNLRVVSVGQYNALLQWDIPNNMVDFLPDGVQHKIEYQIAGIDNTSYFRSVDVSSLPRRNKTFKFMLSNLPYAHMIYEVRIRIRPVSAIGEEYWSNNTYVMLKTIGKSMNEMNKSIYESWKQKRLIPVPSFSKKTWHMKSEKAVYDIWETAKGPFSLLSLVMPSERPVVIRSSINNDQ